MAFLDEDYQKLRMHEGNEQLYWNPEDQYTQYRTKDPFPEISDALLNSVDIVKYCMTTGMIEPFDIKEVKGVTYTCHFSGKYFYWDGQANNLHKKTDDDDSELILRPNSITYLEIDEMLRVPDYLIIRYNLQVTHVYKGLLLGTGPIVDPGFVGRLYIPLHNLTSNEYRIKRGAPLITLEFTKVGRNRDSENKTIWPESAQGTLDFTALHHQPEEIRPKRNFNVYLQKALLGNELFRSTKDIVCVGSSIPEKMESAEASAKAAEASAKAAEQSAKGSESSLESTKKVLFGLGVAGAIALIISVGTLLNDVNGRIDNVLSENISFSAENDHLKKENDRLEEEIERLGKANDELQKIIDRLTSGETDMPDKKDSK